MVFADRTDAGDQLAERLLAVGVEADLVLAIPRGGLPVGRAVADRLGAPLDVVVAEKLGAPFNPELAIGAVAGDGSRWLNDELIAQLNIDADYLDRVSEKEAASAREKVTAYRAGEPLPAVADKRVVLVDDGVATGATAIACLRQLRANDAARIVLAVPVAPPEMVDALRDEADDIVVVDTPRYFGAVGSHYRDFGQVSNAEAIAYLDET
ncbi:phosphoribosyltransferase [Haloferacaceae archaeon DSL9]